MARLWASKTSDDEWWSSFVTSPAAILVNYVAVDISWITPNLLTLASFVTALIAAVAIGVGGVVNFAIAAVLIHLSHVLDCMDGQMARFRGTTSASGSFFDRATDQLQVSLWFGAVGYAAYLQSDQVLPLLLAFVGVSFYSLRGYAKYVEIHIEMARDPDYLHRQDEADSRKATAIDIDGPSDLLSACRWFVREQRKIFDFNEGVFIFMLSAALLLNQLTPMLWVFAASQTSIGSVRTWRRGQNIELQRQETLAK